MRSISLEEKSEARSILPMIAKMSIATFNKLPYASREGSSVADLISEAKILIITKAAKRFDPKLNVKWSTFAFTVLENHFKDVLRDAHTQKAYAQLYSLDYAYTDQTGSRKTLLDRMSRSRTHVMENKLIARIDAERGFLKAYAVASPTLRKYLIAWLLQPKSASKIKEGIKCSSAMKEFSTSATRFLTPEMCDTIQQDYQCRHTIANKVMSRFFTPRNDTCIHSPNFTSRKTIEHAILPILSAERRASIVALV